MKKIVAIFLVSILALTQLPLAAVAAPGDYPTTASFDSDLPGNPDQAQAAADAAVESRKAQLTDAGQQVGCASEGEFGGAVANALGVALQNVVTGTLLGKFNEIGQKIASKAGPFAPLVSKAFNVLGGILATKVNNAIGGVVNQITGQVGQQAGQALSQVGSALGIDVGSALGSTFGGGLGAGIGAGLGVAGIAGGLAAVPVKYDELLQVQKDTKKLTEKIDVTTDKTRQAQYALDYKECVSDPLVAKIKNALLAFITRSLIDWVNGGMSGDTAFVQNLQQFLHEGINAVTQDIIENQLSGICTPYKQDVQRIILTQYQYNTNYGKRSQCGLTSQQQAYANSNTFDRATWWQGVMNPSDSGFGSVILAQDEQRQQAANYAAQTIIETLTNDGYKSIKKCTDDSTPPKGGYCDGNTQQIVTPGVHVADAVNRKLGLADQQLISADEIGEIIDALMQSLTQVAFQGVDGLLGLSKKSSGSNQGSYLDQVVASNVGDAGTSVQNILGSDLSGALDTEQTYHDTVALVIADLTNARKGYVAVIACYQPLTTGGNAHITSQTALDTLTLASSTISQVIDPQLTEFRHLLTDSEESIEQLQNLLDQSQVALTVSDYNTISVGFTALKQSGTLHNATDLNYLLNGLETGAQTLEALLQDANTRLAVCKAP